MSGILLWNLGLQIRVWWWHWGTRRKPLGPVLGCPVTFRSAWSLNSRDWKPRLLPTLKIVKENSCYIHTSTLVLLQKKPQTSTLVHLPKKKNPYHFIEFYCDLVNIGKLGSWLYFNNLYDRTIPFTQLLLLCRRTCINFMVSFLERFYFYSTESRSHVILLRSSVASFLNMEVIMLRTSLFCMNGWLNTSIPSTIRRDTDFIVSL